MGEERRIATRCGDCGAEPMLTVGGSDVYYAHAPDCLTVEVEAGRMTPRERQIARLDRDARLDDLLPDEKLRLAIQEHQVKHARSPTRALMHPEDLHRLLRETGVDASVDLSRGVGDYEFCGIPVVSNPSVPQGEIVMIDDRVVVGFDPAQSGDIASAAGFTVMDKSAIRQQVAFSGSSSHANSHAKFSNLPF